MSRSAHNDFREVGLEIGLIVGRYLLDMDDLHYGYWPDGLERHIKHLPVAQEAFSDFLVGHVPAGARTILDVGCGAGNLASRLLKLGREVDVVSPGEYLTERVRAKIGGAGRVYACKFEAMPLEKTYDLVLFSESFQYMNLDLAMERLPKLVRPGGHLLICDFFKTGAPGKSAMAGGRKLALFLDAVKSSPFTIETDLDITARTAPTVDILGEGFMRVGKPVRDILFDFLSKAYPLTSRLLRWLFRRRLAKLDAKFFSDRITAAEFAIHKTYRLFLLRRA